MQLRDQRFRATVMTTVIHGGQRPFRPPMPSDPSDLAAEVGEALALLLGHVIAVGLVGLGDGVIRGEPCPESTQSRSVGVVDLFEDREAPSLLWWSSRIS
ncbi:MAG: hypothetical protein ACRDRO_14825 [Pseudonocardiaceae bacterium]